MEMNIGPADRLVRAILGTALVVFSGLSGVADTWTVIAMVAGCVAVFTAAAAYCPLYRVLHFTTQPVPAGLEPGAPGG